MNQIIEETYEVEKQSVPDDNEDEMPIIKLRSRRSRTVKPKAAEQHPMIVNKIKAEKD